MDADIMQLQTLLMPIEICIVGEVALSYYNVDRVIHDVEVCVSAGKLSEALSVIDANNELFERFDWPKGPRNIFTDYKSVHVRFRAVKKPEFVFVILPDTLYRLDPLKDNIIREHPNGREYSDQILSLVSDKDAISSIPFPRLAPFFSGLLRQFNESEIYVFAMCAEQLVDGMNLDEDWCKSHLNARLEEEYKYASKLVKGKNRRISPMYPDYITCYIDTPDEARRVCRIPGRN